VAAPRRDVGHWNHPATRAAHSGRRHDAAAVCDSDGNYHVVRLPSLDEFVPRTQSNRQQYHSEGDQENARPAQSRNGFPRTNFARKVSNTILAAVMVTAKLRSAIQGRFRKAPGQGLEWKRAWI
jgi:hypothetical protein